MTFRPISQDSKAKAGFDAVSYIDGIWDSKIVPTVQQNAIDLKTLLAEIDKDKNAASQKYGHRSGTGSYSFLVKGEAKVIDVDTTSRAGVINIDIATDDGAQYQISIGPVIMGNAIRDGIGFIQFNDFTNQLDFADVTKELNKRVSANVVKTVDLASVKGRAIFFQGAFSLDDRQKITITPVTLEVR